jgi:hypothetical protein
MFFFAGGITVIWGVLVLFFLPPDPVRSKGLTEREHYIAVARLRVNNTGVRNVHLKPSQLLEGLLDLKFWAIFSMAFLMMIVNGPSLTYQAIIVKSFGFNSLDSLLLLMPYGFVSGCLQLGAPYLATKFKNARTYIIVASQCLGILAQALLWLLPSSAIGGKLFGIYFLGSFVGSYAMTMTLSMANTAGYTKRVLASSGLFVGYCFGNFVGPLVVKPEDAPVYAPAWIASIVTSAATGVLALLYRFLCIRENRRRDATGILEGHDHAYEDDLTDQKVSIRDTSVKASTDSFGRRIRSSATSTRSRMRIFLTLLRAFSQPREDMIINGLVLKIVLSLAQYLHEMRDRLVA